MSNEYKKKEEIFHLTNPLYDFRRLSSWSHHGSSTTNGLRHQIAFLVDRQQFAVHTEIAFILWRPVERLRWMTGRTTFMMLQAIRVWLMMIDSSGMLLLFLLLLVVLRGRWRRLWVDGDGIGGRRSDSGFRRRDCRRWVGRCCRTNFEAGGGADGARGEIVADLDQFGDESIRRRRCGVDLFIYFVVACAWRF